MANNAGLPTFLDMTTPMYNPMATPNYDHLGCFDQLNNGGNADEMNIVCGMQSPHPYYGGMQYQSMSTATGGSSIGLGQYSAGASGGLTSTTTTGSN